MYIPKLEPNQTSCDIYTARAGGGASNCRLRFASTSAYAGLGANTPPLHVHTHLQYKRARFGLALIAADQSPNKHYDTKNTLKTGF